MRTKISIINLIADVIPGILLALLGIFKIKVFLTYMGEDLVGLYQLYNQLFSYIALLEGGLIGAALFRLYKPVADKNEEEVSRQMSAVKIIFSGIGIAMFVIGVVLSFCLDFFIKDNSLSSGFMQVTFLLYTFSNVIGYFNIPAKLAFEAYQKKYIITTITQWSQVLKSLLEFLIVYLGFGLFGMLITGIILNLISNILIQILFKKQYSINMKNKNKNFTFLKDLKHLIVHKISSLISYNTDVLIISKVLGLSSVVIYTSYNYITDTIRMIFEKITSATQAPIGELLVRDKKKGESIFLEYNSIVYFIAGIICVPLVFALPSFIQIWYKGKITSSLILSCLFTFNLSYNLIRIPILSFMTAAGLFKETKLPSIIEAVSNVVLSLLLVHQLGMIGVLIATAVSYLIGEYFWKPFILYKKVFEKNSPWLYYKKSLLYILFIAVLLGFGYFVNSLIVIPNIFAWFGFNLIYFGINFIFLLILYYYSKQLTFLNRFQFLLKKVKK